MQIPNVQSKSATDNSLNHAVSHLHLYLNTNLLNYQIYWNNKIMSAWRLYLPVSNVWTNSIQIFTLQTVII